MYDINRKHYIIKQSSGKVLNIFHKENSGIFLSTLNNKNLWTDAVLLMKDALPDFSACIDTSDNIHILCQDNHGNIMHMFSTGSSWDTKPVLNSRNPSPYDTHPEILCVDNTIYFFFIVEYSGKKILAFQGQNSLKAVSSPRVIDYIERDNTSYNVLKDMDNDLYIFYRFSNRKYNQIGYKSYISSKDRWREFQPITRYTGDSEVLSTAVDHKNNLHACWQKVSPKNYELMYSRKHCNSEKWDMEKTLSVSSDSFSSCSFISLEDRIIAYWIKNDDIVYCISENNGDTWSKPETYQFSSTRPLCCINYKTNVPDEYRYTYFNELPGNISDGYKLAFINESVSGPENTDTNDFHTMIVNTLDVLSRNVGEIKQSIKDLSEKFEVLNAKQKQITIETDKWDIKSSMVDSDLAKIKNELETLKRIVKAGEIKGDREGKKDTEDAAVKSVKKVEEVGDVNDVKEDLEGKELKEIKENKGILEGETAKADVTDFNGQQNRPIMPGTGFKSITPEYLWSFHKK